MKAKRSKRTMGKKVRESRFEFLSKVWQKLIEWRNDGVLDKHLASKATRKGHKHFHGKTRLSERTTYSPAQYRNLHKGRSA